MRSRWWLHWAKAARIVGLLRLLDRRLEVQDARRAAGCCISLGRSLGVDHRALHHHHEPVDAVPQLADVPRPRVVAQDPHRRPGDLLGLASLPRAGPLEEMLDEQGDVVAPLAQGGHAQGHHVEAVVQVLAELALGDELVDVPVRRGDQPHVERDQRLAPEPAHLPLLEDAEQVDLGLGGHLADLVEEQRAALRHLEPAGLLAHRAAERPLLVAEQLALDQRLGQRPDVGGDERAGHGARSGCGWPGRSSSLPVPLSPWISTVRSVSATWRMQANDLADRGALADDLRELARGGQPVAEPAVLLTQAVVLEGLADLEPQHLQVDRLGDVVVRPQAHRLDGRLDRAVGGDHQDQRLRPARA